MVLTTENKKNLNPFQFDFIALSASLGVLALMLQKVVFEYERFGSVSKTVG